MQQVIQTVERLIGFAKEVMINITELADLKEKDYFFTGEKLHWSISRKRQRVATEEAI